MRFAVLLPALVPASLLGALLVFSTVQPVNAQTEVSAPSAIVQDAHADLFASMREGLDKELILRNLVRSVVEQMTASDPQLAALENEYPGLALKMMDSMMPVLRGYTRRVERKYDPQLIAVLRSMFTPDEARNIAAFYRSDLGRQVLASTAQNLDAENAIADTVRDEDISREFAATR